MEASFVGVDLAWKEGNHSGLAAFRGDILGAQPVAFGSGATSLDSVFDFILAHRAETIVVAIDAPLIIGNAGGHRPCERLVTQKFGSAHAGAHSSNLTLYPNAGSVALAHKLESAGFRHCTAPDRAWDESGHWFFEVYPHPAQVVLFNRSRIIKYKNVFVAERRAGLDELRKLMGTRMLGVGRSLGSSARLAGFLSCDLQALRGAALKHYEDGLDAIVCAFLAFHLWRWGWERSEFIGDLTDGTIVVPTVALPPGDESGRLARG